MDCKKYFDDSSKEVDFPSIKATISLINPKILDPNGDIGLEVGKINKRTKINIPENISAKLVELDLLQYNACTSISTLGWWSRRNKRKELANTVLKMYNLIIKNYSESNNNEKESELITTSNFLGNDNRNKDLKKYLDERNFKSAYLPNNLNQNAGYIIWPVKLLPSITYIHNAQMQLIKLLVKAGWKLLVIIGDCGKSENIYSAGDFSNSIKTILKKNEIPIEENTIALLSEYYKREENVKNNRLVNGVTSTNLLNTFHAISDGMVWENFSKLIKKNYDNKKQLEIDKRSVLNNIQSLLTWSLVATIVKENEEKKPNAIIIAGEDEHEQWDYIASAHSNNKMGIIFIHELKNEDGTTMDQVDFNIRSQNEMYNKLNDGNMAEWLYTHFIELPKFLLDIKPHFCKTSDIECTKYKNNCLKCLFTEGKNYENDTFDKKEFVETIYPIANPAY